jgi:peptide methionine sulfoxide reductase MsrA
MLEPFFQVHDPTTYEQQVSDFGRSYRSAIFYTDEQQKETALATIVEIEASGLWPGPVVSEITPERPVLGAAEHQHYLQQHQGATTVSYPAELAASIGSCIPEITNRQAGNLSGAPMSIN